MKEIKMLVEDIHEELEGAEHYAKLATQYRDTDRALADTYATMATQELSHVDALHNQAVRKIKEYRAESGSEPPASMQAVWDWEHDKMTDHVVRVRTLLDVYNRR